MAAFAGIITALSHTFYGGFICCLPVLFLDIALCWQLQPLCEKRLPFSAPVLNKQRLPSWSWVGWKGGVTVGNWIASFDYIKSPTTRRDYARSERTLPLIQWFSRELIDSEPRLIEASRYAWELKESSLRGGIDLPRGWSRFEHIPSQSEVGRSPGLTPPQYFYQHESDPSIEFWYPIPLCSLQQPQKQNYDSLLSCFTQRTFLCLAERFGWGNVYGPITLNPQFSIRDDQGRWLGALQPDEELPPMSQEPKPMDEKSCVSCELVAISRGYAYEGYAEHGMAEWTYNERPKAGGKGSKYEYYNVLWVEWVEGIAFRKGLGRIEKSAWEEQELEQIELILG